MSVKILNESSPCVSTFWYIDSKDEFVGPEINYKDAVYYGDYGQCDSDHFDEWSLVKRSYRLTGNYDYYPRGRVMFNSLIHKFVVVCDRCIADNEELRNKLRDHYHLPVTTIFKTDEHYTCHNCRR